MPFATTAAVIGLGLSAAGTAASVVGNVKAGNAAKNQGEFNAGIDEQNARNAISDATSNEQQQRLDDRRVIASNTAAIGASGIDVNSGSPLDVLAEQHRQGELNALNVRRQGALQAQADLNDAQAQRMAGANAQTASRYNAASSLLTGGVGIIKQLPTVKRTTPSATVPNSARNFTAGSGPIFG